MTLFQSGEHFVQSYSALSQPCWKKILSALKDSFCLMDYNELPAVVIMLIIPIFYFCFFKKTIAFELLACYRIETKKTPLTNCSEHQANNTLFKRCLSNLGDEAFDDYMVIFGQVFMMCEYYNGTRPIITMDSIVMVFFLQFFKNLYKQQYLHRIPRNRLTVCGETWKKSHYFVYSSLIFFLCHGEFPIYTFYFKLSDLIKVLEDVPKMAYVYRVWNLDNLPYMSSIVKKIFCYHTGYPCIRNYDSHFCPVVYLADGRTVPSWYNICFAI